MPSDTAQPSRPAPDPAPPADEPPVLAVEGLRTWFATEEGDLPAVNGVTFSVPRGKTLAIVGESGCGKSVSAYSILRLIQPPGEIVAGSIRLRTDDDSMIDVVELGEKADQLYHLRGGVASMIFQEPMTALNPVFTIGRQLTDGLRRHRGLSASKAEARALELLQEVRLPEPARRLKQYPHELSGGMRQRVVIAMAMACRPQLLIADEPTTALDVTIQAEILGLIKRLKREFGMAVLFITHDMAVVERISHRLAVMLGGRIIETGPTAEVLHSPQRAYTRKLIEAVPHADMPAEAAARHPPAPEARVRYA